MDSRASKDSNPADERTNAPADGASAARPLGLVGGDEPASNEGAAVEPKPAASADAIGTVVGRRYEINERLGSGRRGVVYLARDRLTDARVAVKRLRTDEPLREAVSLALAAAELQATIRHPGIARIFEVGEDATGSFIVSEYIDGPDLAKFVASNGAYELASAIRVIGDVGEAMIAAHEIGLFHGSVRGSNVLLAPDGTVKVVDFSIANIVPADHPKARRQDVRGLARTLCQLLTGVSRGTVNVHELPKPIRPVIRHAMGRSVASRQSTMDHFLRELRASDLDEDTGPLSEADAVRKGREAELSGSFAAMRAAGEEAQQANAESAEAMVLLRRADALESEKNELVRLVEEREAAFDYAGALDALGKLIRRFPADHHVIRLAGQKRQTLADLTRLRGLGEQMVASGRIAESVGAWQRVLELRPDDPAAQVQVRLGKSARLKRRVATLGSTAAILAVLGVGGWFAWTQLAVSDVPGLPRLAGTDSGAGFSETDPGAARAGNNGADDSRPAPVNPLVRSDASKADRNTVGGPPPIELPTDAVADAAETGNDGTDDASASGPAAVAPAPRPAFAIEAEQAARDAASARVFAENAGAPGLSPASFESASARHDEGQMLLETGEYAEASGLLASARGTYISAASEARSRIAAVETLIGDRKLRAAARAIDTIRDAAPDRVIADLSAALEAARGMRLDIAPGVAAELRYIEPGVFNTGSPADEPGRRSTEDIRQVRIERPYWIMSTELTQRQFAAAMGEPVPTGGTDGSELPATGLSLDDAVAVAARLSELTGGTFRVPTEHQWEYACRADTAAPHAGLDIEDAAWWLATSDARLRPVGSLAPNPWGLYDTLGNAAELVIAPSLGHGEQVAMTRGGSYLSPASAVRAAARHELVPRDRGDTRTGVRLIWTPDEQPDETP